MDYISMARQLRQLILNASKNLPDEEAVNIPFAYPKWEEGISYQVGDRVRYGEDLYKVLTTHTSQFDWIPEYSPSLFAKVLPGQDGTDIGDWVQPDSTNPYMTGDKVRFEGHIYESLIDNNIWSPAAYPAGWKQID